MGPEAAEASARQAGLVPDTLAALYPEGADMLLRFEDMATLDKLVTPHVAEVRRLLSVAGVPKGSPSGFLRRAFKLPADVDFDTGRPFALVRWKGRWMGFLPTLGTQQSERMKRTGPLYCAVGPPDLVAAYAPAGRGGYVLAGQAALLAVPGALADLSAGLSELLEPLGLTPPALASLAGHAKDLTRIDLALRFSPGDLQIDLRLAPRAEGALASTLSRLVPDSSRAARLLPRNATLYAEWTSPRDELVALAGTRLPPDATAFLGTSAACSVQLGAEGPGSLCFVAELDDAAATHAFFRSSSFENLLRELAGDGGHLDWTPEIFRRQGAVVGLVTGHVGRPALQRLREAGPSATVLATLLRGPVVAYVGIGGERLGVVIGQRARPEAERFFDGLASGEMIENPHSAQVALLHPKRFAALTVDLAGLVEGCREAGPFLFPGGRGLLDLRLRTSVPVTASLTIEGGALRATATFSPRQVASVIAQICIATKRGS
ncbi:MAG: hypothetical protein ACT4PV_00405 [Planctomycetaceae bacterium]